MWYKVDWTFFLSFISFTSSGRKIVLSQMAAHRKWQLAFYFVFSFNNKLCVFGLWSILQTFSQWIISNTGSRCREYLFSSFIINKYIKRCLIFIIVVAPMSILLWQCKRCRLLLLWQWKLNSGLPPCWVSALPFKPCHPPPTELLFSVDCSGMVLC